MWNIKQIMLLIKNKLMMNKSAKGMKIFTFKDELDYILILKSLSAWSIILTEFIVGIILGLNQYIIYLPK